MGTKRQEESLHELAGKISPQYIFDGHYGLTEQAAEALDDW